ncbi:NAD(P)-dependent oxidoreductase [Pedobacter psychrodurus]|uniref:NAD(P)-dependent oxidoreductase n=1 Tax=Pedobacter psychrodurus TaxID=2530456 RepID=UPI002931280E|nr:NAD(P)-dependent oxidoreductase [Pedobacter psychrodurus]
MKVALIGASGFVGKAVLNELLQKGHQVTAVVRNVENLASENGLNIVKADATDIEVLTDLVKDSDVVISAFNAGWGNPDMYRDFLIGSKAIQEGVKRSGVKRYVVIGGAGSLFIDGKQLVDSPEFPAEYKDGAMAAREYLNYLMSETELDWVFLSPAIEMHPGTSGIRKGSYRIGTDTPVFDTNGRSIISVEDTALAVVDEIENSHHSRQRFTVAY